ncbi:MAG: DUF6812 domain-containing protein [Desulfobacca sp.]|uniref:DUF6812 domain-containing protein n=1 Tax=Desulfobacca sp. TaxID=2067990 RepID=UPI00404B110E
MSVITRGHMDARPITLKLVDGSVITGKINLIQRGEHEHRVSDIFVGRKEPFVVIFQATLDGEPDQVLVVNKRHIIWVKPEEKDNPH